MLAAHDVYIVLTYIYYASVRTPGKFIVALNIEKKVVINVENQNHKSQHILVFCRLTQNTVKTLPAIRSVFGVLVACNLLL